MVTINSNYAAAFAANSAKQISSGLDSAMEKLSSGKRINYASDDAAGQAIATRLTAEIQGMAVASRNAADGQSMLNTADGALQESHNILLRMRELAVQAGNGTMNSDDQAALDKEFQALDDEVNRIATKTTWAGTSLLDATGGASGTFAFQAGVLASETIDVSIADMKSATIGIASLAVSDTTKANAAITALDTAIKKVSTERANLGAFSNRLDSTVANLGQIGVNLAASKGRIEDADFAQETGNLAKNQILQQAATAMVAQANTSKSTVLTLLRG
jgi:flagellin